MICYCTLLRGVCVIRHLLSLLFFCFIDSCFLILFHTLQHPWHTRQRACATSTLTTKFSFLWLQQLKVNCVETKSRLCPLSQRLGCKQTKCTLTAITSISLLLGVVSFSVELSNKKSLCQRENGSTRSFARKKLTTGEHDGDGLIAFMLL